MAANMTNEKNEEVWLHDATDVMYWCVAKCLAASCSNATWKKADRWSLQSADQAKKYVKRHLVKSSHHQMSGEEADVVILTLHIAEMTHFASTEEEQHGGRKRQLVPHAPNEPPPRHLRQEMRIPPIGARPLVSKSDYAYRVGGCRS